MGNFCILAVFDISATRGRIHTKFYLCRDNVCRRAPSPSGVHRPLGGGGVAKCGSICRTQTSTLWCRTVKIGQGVSTGLAKKIEKIEFFTISRVYVHISQKLLKIEAYKQHTEKALSLPYPTVACVWTRRSRGSTG